MTLPTTRSVALALGIVLLVGCTRQAEPHAGTGTRGVVFVLIDTLRADHLGAYGYTRPTSPRMDALAADGTLFENALTTAPWTLPAMGSVWTSLYPTIHGATKRSNEAILATDPTQFRPFTVLDPSRTTLAEILHAHGIRTAGFVDGVYPGAIFGFSRGFDAFVEDGPTGARMNVESALAWLDRDKPERFFLYLHLVDVHSPYMPTAIPPAVAARHDREAARVVELLRQEQVRYRTIDFDPGYSGGVDGSQQSLARLRVAAPGPDPRDVEHAIALYDRGIVYADHWVGELVDGLRQRGLYDRTTIVVTADHGEEFFEHGRLEHGINQYDEIMKVPFIVRDPTIGHGRRVREQISLLDVMPTVLDVFDIPAPPGLQGMSIRPALDGHTLPDRTLFSEADQSDRVKAMRATAFKYIQNGKRPELYDLRVDKREAENLCADAESCAEFTKMLRDWERDVAALAALKPTPPDAVLDRGAHERLHALGYE